MTKDEYPINTIYDGVGEMLMLKGDIKYITCTDFVESQTVVDYGDYRYTIIKHLGEIIAITRYERSITQ